MKRTLALVATLFVLGSYGCASVWDVNDPAVICERAEAMWAEAAFHHKDAADCAVLIEKSEGQLKPRQMRLDALLERRAELDDRIVTLETRGVNLSEDEARKLDITLSRYAQERDAISATVDDEIARIRVLEGHIASQRRLHDAHLRYAEDSEWEAQRLDDYALRLSER